MNKKDSGKWGRFRELSEAELICIWGGVNRRNLLASLVEIEHFLTERQSTRVYQGPSAAPFLLSSDPSPRR
jgi:hypothetical protein